MRVQNTPRFGGMVRLLSACCAIATLMIELSAVSALPPAASARTAVLRSTRHDLWKAVPRLRKKNPQQSKKKDKTADPLAMARSAVAAAHDQLDAAQKSAREAAQELHAIEAELERSQPEDSPLAQAKARFDSAQNEHKKLVDRAVQSPEYQAALEKLGSSSDRRPEDVAKLRKSMVSSDAHVMAAAAELSQAREEYQKLRDKLFQGDAGWRESTAKLKTLRREQSANEAEARKAVTEKNRVEEQIKQVQREAEQAEARKRQAQADKKQSEAAKQRATQAQKARQEGARRRQQLRPQNR